MQIIFGYKGLSSLCRLFKTTPIRVYCVVFTNQITLKLIPKYLILVEIWMRSPIKTQALFPVLFNRFLS